MTRRLLHIVRTERGRALCEPAAQDRVVVLGEIAASELLTLIFEYDGVVVW